MGHLQFCPGRLCHVAVWAQLGQIFPLSGEDGNLNVCEKSPNFSVVSVSNKKEEQHRMGQKVCGLDLALVLLILGLGTRCSLRLSPTLLVWDLVSGCDSVWCRNPAKEVRMLCEVPFAEWVYVATTSSRKPKDSTWTQSYSLIR